MSRLFGPIIQNAYVVTDMEAALRHWTEEMGVGPFFFAPRMALEDIDYRGTRISTAMGWALAYSGDLQIELVQPLDDSPSIYREFLDAGHSGLQHVCVTTNRFDDLMAEAAKRGMVTAQRGRTATANFAYLDVNSRYPGNMVEVLEETPEIMGLFAMIKAASVGWDGRDPVRTL